LKARLEPSGTDYMKCKISHKKLDAHKEVRYSLYNINERENKMNYATQTTGELVDNNGKDKADIAEIQGRIEAREVILKRRIKAGESQGDGIFQAAHIIQNCKSTAWKTIAERLGVSSQMKVANTTKYTKDYFKYTARKV